MYKVFCDESGNTGTNFFDKAQPILVYASHCIDSGTCERILKNNFPNNTAPIKHKQMKKRNPDACIKSIGELIKNHNDSIFFSISDKYYSIAARMVDYIVEDYFHDHGVDLYVNRNSKNYVDMLGLSRDVIGQAEFEFTLNLFYNFACCGTNPKFKGDYDDTNYMCSGMTKKDYDKYSEDCYIKFKNQIKKLTLNNDFGYLFEPISEWLNNNDHKTKNFAKDYLRLSTSDIFLVMNYWSSTKDDIFNLYCDETKELAREIDWLKGFLHSEDKPNDTFGYSEGRTWTTNTKCIEIKPVTDDNYKEIQISDLLAGAIAEHSIWLFNGKPHNKYAENINIILGDKRLHLNILQFERPDFSQNHKRFKTFDEYVVSLHNL